MVLEDLFFSRKAKPAHSGFVLKSCVLLSLLRLAPVRIEEGVHGSVRGLVRGSESMVQFATSQFFFFPFPLFPLSPVELFLFRLPSFFFSYLNRTPERFQGALSLVSRPFLSLTKEIGEGWTTSIAIAFQSHRF